MSELAKIISQAIASERQARRNEPKWLSSIREYDFPDGVNIIGFTQEMARSVQRVVGLGGMLFVYTDEEPSDALIDEMERVIDGGEYSWVGRIGPTGVITIGVCQTMPVDCEAIKEGLDGTLVHLRIGSIGDLDATVFREPYVVLGGQK